jgi:outer membrane protein assembly factor BamB
MSMSFCRKPARAGLALTMAFAVSIGAAAAGAAPDRGKVVAVDKRTGRPVWEASLWSRPELAVPPLVTDQRVYVLEDGKTLKALDAVTGRIRWQKPVASHLPLTLVGDLVVAVTGETAIAFNQVTGKRAWEFNPRIYPEWKFDEQTIPVVAPGRLLLPAADTVIAIDPATGQPAWAYTVTAAVLPLRPVVAKDMVYLSSGREESPVCLKLEDGLPNTGEYALPAHVARALARARKNEKPPAASRPQNSRGKTPFISIRTAVAPGGGALAAAGARAWRFPAPAGWTIDRVAGESLRHVYALLAGTASAIQPGKAPVR